jgi:hypothetical protein
VPELNFTRNVKAGWERPLTQEELDEDGKTIMDAITGPFKSYNLDAKK